jgi:hypothetical protein
MRLPFWHDVRGLPFLNCFKSSGKFNCGGINLRIG